MVLGSYAPGDDGQTPRKNLKTGSKGVSSGRAPGPQIGKLSTEAAFAWHEAHLQRSAMQTSRAQQSGLAEGFSGRLGADTTLHPDPLLPVFRFPGSRPTLARAAPSSNRRRSAAPSR